MKQPILRTTSPKNGTYDPREKAIAITVLHLVYEHRFEKAPVLSHVEAAWAFAYSRASQSLNEMFREHADPYIAGCMEIYVLERIASDPAATEFDRRSATCHLMERLNQLDRKFIELFGQPITFQLAQSRGFSSTTFFSMRTVSEMLTGICPAEKPHIAHTKALAHLSVVHGYSAPDIEIVIRFCGQRKSLAQVGQWLTPKVTKGSVFSRARRVIPDIVHSPSLLAA